MDLCDRLALGADRYAFLIGGGGKTSLMFALARELAGGGRSVLTTTSTRILEPGPDDSPLVVVSADMAPLLEQLRAGLRDRVHVTAGRSRVGDRHEKLAGFAPGELDVLEAAAVADVVLVEADGSAGRPLKAHLEHEPVLSERAGLVIVVIGLSAIGEPATDATVHRAARWCERANLPPGHVLTADEVAAMVFHPEGYLKKVPPRARVALFLSQAGTAIARASGEALREAVLRRDRDRRIERVVVGELREPLAP